MKKNNLTNNIIYKLIYQFVSLIFPLITIPYVSRILSVNGLGKYYYYNSIILYFTSFAMLGISIYGSRIIAKNKKNICLNFSNLYFFQIINTLICICLFLIFFFFSNDKTICIIFSIYLINCLFDINWLYFGLEKFKFPIIIQTFFKLITIILIFVYVKKTNDLVNFILLKCLCDFIPTFLLWIFAINKLKIKKISFKVVFKYVKPCLILFIPIISAFVYQQMDKVLLGFIKGYKDVGYYACSEKLITISFGIIACINSVISPKISNLLGQKKKKEAENIINKSIVLLSGVGFALMFGIISIANDFVPLFFGNNYSKCINLTILYSFCIPFLTMSNTLRNVFLIPYEFDKIHAISIIIGAILNIVINIILIPTYGVYGAVIGTIGAEMGVCIYQIFILNNKILFKNYLKYVCFYLLLGIIMTCSIKLMPVFNFNVIINLILKVIIGSFIYLSFFYLVVYKKICKKV